MDAIAGKVIEGLTSLALEEFNLLDDLRNDKERMEYTVSAIKAILRDADAQANAMSHQVNDWLKKLKDVLYDAEDLLDDFSAESLAREVRNRGRGKLAKKVRTFCSKSNQVAYSHEMSRRMKDIRKKFDDIADDKNKLHLVAGSSKPPNAIKERRETYSFVREEEVIGREEEKNLLKRFLMNTNVSKDVSIITIVGFGGLGKTALAQLVYNDAAVQSFFEPKMWVCVSDQFSIKEIGQKMLQRDKDANIEKVQEELREKIRGRRYLLVLDDVWNEDRNLWLQLKSLLMEGGKGSMIIVTTRIAKVKKIMEVDFPLDLKGLDDERSWKLFSRMAFEGGKEPNIPELVKIGKEIVKKCAGIPLALKTIGSLLYTHDLMESDWLYFRDNELLRVDQENNDMLPILKLSYDHLSSNLKNCFTFCSLFPKDYEIEKETLIQSWMAQGFVRSSDQVERPEDVGDQYFQSLLSRSFFQDVLSNEFGDITMCKMHDLMHDLATLVSKNECMVVKEGNRENIEDTTRHLSFDVTVEACWRPQTRLLKAGKLRTFLASYLRVKPRSRSFLNCLANIFCCHVRWMDADLDESVIDSIISSLKRLRILDLPHLEIPTIPRNIQKLKHLRYLDLSGNYSIQKLPKGINSLHRLQTLKLNRCMNLKKLPRDINNLVSLRHLELDECLSLCGMPHGLGQLTSLQTMTQFALGPRKSDSARLSELGDLNNLRGRLSICGLEHMRSNVEDVESAKLLMKPHLQVLDLCWYDDDMGEKEEVVGRDEMILQGLQPYRTIKALSIWGFCGNKLSDWIGYLPSLRRLRILDCTYLTSLPEWIGNFSSLQKLDFVRCKVLTSLPESICNLSSLLNLTIANCKLLTSLPECIGNLSSLQKLDIEGCEVLTSLPESICNLSSLLNLRIAGCKLLTSLSECIGNLSSLRDLEIAECEVLTLLPESICNLSSLLNLRIADCKLLTSLPECIDNLSSLQKLDIVACGLLISLPESIGQLSLLQHLRIYFCNGLTFLPEGIRNLKSLQLLDIYSCSQLKERCEREKGDDWPKIAYIHFR